MEKSTVSLDIKIKTNNKKICQDIDEKYNIIRNGTT